MDYEYDIFISYRRTDTVGRWVQNHLVPRLTLRLNEEAPRNIRIFYDLETDSGSNWPEKLKRELCRSGLLISVGSADYFRSKWCTAEWWSFRKREEMLGLFTAAEPQGLIHLVRYADGDHFDADAKTRQCKWDFSSLNYPEESFSATPKYMEFDDQVKQMAKELVKHIARLPPFQSDFPIDEREPLEPVSMLRPVL